MGYSFRHYGLPIRARRSNLMWTQRADNGRRSDKKSWFCKGSAAAEPCKPYGNVHTHNGILSLRGPLLPNIPQTQTLLKAQPLPKPEPNSKLNLKPKNEPSNSPLNQPKSPHCCFSACCGPHYVAYAWTHKHHIHILPIITYFKTITISYFSSWVESNHGIRSNQEDHGKTLTISCWSPSFTCRNINSTIITQRYEREQNLNSL